MHTPRPSLLSAALLLTNSAFASPVACEVSQLQALANPGTTITAASFIAAPAHCLIDGTVAVDKPGPWALRFRLGLPVAFKNRYLMFSQGGSGGGSVPWAGAGSSVVSPLQHDFDRLLNQGFAIAATDKGTAPKTGSDFSWQADPVQKLNWDNRAIETVAEVTQDLTRKFYGSPPTLHRYISGCSGGGMASFNNIRVHGGKSFDGIVIGSTVGVSPAAALAWPRIMKHIALHPDGWISPDLLKKAQEAILAAYDTVDGVQDGIIDDPRKIVFDYKILTGVGFTPAQVETFKLVVSPWTYYGTDKPIQVPGFSFTRPTDWTVWFIGSAPPPWAIGKPGTPVGFLVSDSSFRALFGSQTNFVTDLDLDSPALHKKLQAGTYDAGQHAPFDFRTYRDKGGKLMTYYGVDDAAIPVDWTSTIRNGAEAYEGSPADLNNWFRSYRIPGSVHCGGGAGPNDTAERMLDAMVKWVENGQAPETITATRKDGKVFKLNKE